MFSQGSRNRTKIKKGVESTEMYDYSKLRGRIKEKFGTEGNFAEALGVSRVTVSNKFNRGKGLSQAVSLKWAELLDISQNEIGVYFFTLKVQDAEQK